MPPSVPPTMEGRCDFDVLREPAGRVGETSGRVKASRAKAAPRAGLALLVVAVPSFALYVDGFGTTLVFENNRECTVLISSSLAPLIVSLKMLPAVRSDQF